MHNIKRLSDKDFDISYQLELETPDKLYYRWTEDEWLQSLKTDEVYGLFVDDQLVGKIGLIERGVNMYEIDGLVVHPTHRRKGFGKKLFIHALKQLAIKKAQSAFLTTHPENSGALILYLTHGFTIDEWQPDKFGPGVHRLKLIKKFDK